jgi:drug/metabolite transporter (DMT)-like permease
MSGDDHTASAKVQSAAVWMVFGAFGFAVMGACSHALGTRCDWLLVAVVRAVFMFASAVILARAAQVRLPVFHPPRLWIRSMAGSISLVCNFYALSVLPVAEAITLSNTFPLWIVLGSLVVLRQRPTRGEIMGVVFGFLGVLLIQRPHLGSDRFAVGVALLASLSTAVALLGLHRLKDVDSRAVVAHFAGVGSLFSIVWLLVKGVDHADRPMSWITIALLAGVCVSGTFGQFMLTRAYASGAPARVSAVGLTQVLFALCFDALIWGRRFDRLTWLGFFFVLSPTLWLSGRAMRRLATTNSSERVKRAAAAATEQS